MTAVPAQRVEMIDLDRIVVVNPRSRNRRIFDEIVDNIAELGLKRPVTVSRRMEADGPFYDLVCGQGRLEAFRALGQKEVPALVVNASEEDCFIASLVENCARRNHRSIDLLQDVAGMKERGYNVPEIARKTGLSAEYVYAVVRLIENGEERLLRAVEAGQIPFSVALQIADTDDAGEQAALQEIYDQNLLRGRKFQDVKKLVEIRRQKGKGLKTQKKSGDVPVSSAMLVRAYEKESARKRLLIRRAETAKNRLTFVVEAVRRISSDRTFLVLLAEEKLDTMPEPLANRLARGGSTR
ncbi:plasmid partitioning protein RepB C-terminal domain-containing protein [uncultured Aureimonas sp.]|uniref:plasmid partitioning protein RepB C-terminal domain-containing protein n=1 Tax=uncultured Aureimonas sp. TaxID=1604662 RepID=UPI0025EAAA46|nr:plasmid partitioning protein RepB C-terminal domain-containing protein [uncultured Aureimonas sp.]